MIPAARSPDALPTMRRILLLALLALACAAPAAAQTDTTAAVRPADIVRLSVWRMPEFTGEFPVAPDGTILHPLLTEVRVVGRPRDDVRRQLREVLLRYENDPQFVFDYLYRVAVTGEVRLPNLYSLPPETSLAQAIAAAGGVSEFGRLNDVRLVRGGQEMVLDLRNPSGPVMEMRIRSGDQIRVLRRGSSFRDYLGLTASIVAAVGSVVAAIVAVSN
jgi:protein involved in polysaccharide export with SLBB domain